MTTYDLDQAAKLTFRMKQLLTNEEFQFGLSTGKRDPAVVDDLLDTMVASWSDDLSARFGQTALTEVTYSEWGTSGFVGFHQMQSLLASESSPATAPLPPQCAVVVSLLNTDDPSISLKRRKGRCYMGLIPASHLDSAGKYSSTNRDAMVAAWGNFIGQLITIVPASLAPTGPCIASEAEGKLIAANQYAVGVGIDTQRRRRQKLNEAISYHDHPTP